MQWPVTFVVAAPRAYHAVLHSGSNMAAANDYADRSWFRCMCSMTQLPDSARLPGRVAVPFEIIYWREIMRTIEMLRNIDFEWNKVLSNKVAEYGARQSPTNKSITISGYGRHAYHRFPNNKTTAPRWMKGVVQIAEHEEHWFEKVICAACKGQVFSFAEQCCTLHGPLMYDAPTTCII